MLRFGTVGVAGLGCIGGSVALAVRQRHVARRVVGFARTPATRRAAVERGAVDEARSPEDGVAGLDFLVIATPLSAVEEFLRMMARADRRLLATDAGSVKKPIAAAARSILGPHNRFVGAHPIAGSEKTGLAAATANLFDGRVTVLTPCAETDPAAREAVREFWEALGSRVVEMSASAHDRCLAFSSHLPHFSSFCLAATISRRDRTGGIRLLAGQGVKDATRIAASDEALWAEIFLFNRDAVLLAVDHYQELLRQMRTALATRDRGTLLRILATARAYRERLDD